MKRELETENTDNSLSCWKEQAGKANGVKRSVAFYFKEMGFLLRLIQWRGENRRRQ